MDISARAISLPDRPRTGRLGHQCSHAPGRPNLHRDVNLVGYGISDVPMTSEEWEAKYCTEEIKGKFSPH